MREEQQAHYLFSSFREKVLEHVFVGELLRYLWTAGVHSVEVLRSEVDGSGYDVVVDCRGVIRHIQLKASRKGGKTPSQNINVGLAKKPCGCIVWLLFDETTLEIGPFRWFGGAPGEALPHLGDKIARHTKGDRTGLKAERPNIRVLSKGSFRELPTLNELVTEMFGPVGVARSSEVSLGPTPPTPTPPRKGEGSARSNLAEPLIDVGFTWTL